MIGMPDESGSRTIQQVREYLLTQLNLALRRPGMFGGEIALWLFMGAMAFTDDREEAWREELDMLRTRGASVSTGVTGAFQRLWGDGHEGAVSSVFAEVAHRQGWLALDRTLSSTEYDQMLISSRSWCTQDRFLSEVSATFGPPSVLFGGTNPNFPKTLAYATGRSEDALICFHLWNGFASHPIAGPAPVHTEPVLLAVRIGGARFADGFTFTPEGTSRRQPSE
jgi:hypothetical protein